MSDREPAARVGDLHSCSSVDPIRHVAGPIVGPGSEHVLIGGWHAAREGDEAICAPSHAAIKAGGLGVLIDGQYAARMTDKTVHGGKITTGYPTVLIGAAKVPLSPDQLVALAMIQIRNSKFAKTPEGKKVLARLEELYGAGKIECKHLQSDKEAHYLVATDKIEINSQSEFAVGQMACLLVHEGTHAGARSRNETAIDEEERCFNNELAYHKQLAGGSGNEAYDKEMRDWANHKKAGNLQDEICHEYKGQGRHLQGCYFGAPQGRPSGSR